jgi:hypothetical protein
MAYSITTTIGNPIATVQDATINTSATPLTLIGRDYAGYGAFLNENFIHLLENFAANTAPDQAKRLTGMLWYDTTPTINTLKVWNTGANVWKPVGSSISQAGAPVSGSPGDLWFDTTNNQLYAWSEIDLDWVLIGPPSTLSGSGAVVTTILDSSSNNHVVIQFKVNNNIVGIVSYDSTFTPQTAIAGFATIKPGFNLVSSSTLTGAQFTGDASNALFLNGVTSGQFLRSDQNTSTAYQLTVGGNLIVGSGLNISTQATEVNFTGTTNNKDINFYANVAGDITVRPIAISGSTGSVGFEKSVNITENLSAGGTLTISGTSTLIGAVNVQNGLLPTNVGTIDIGSSSTNFANVHAKTFFGNIVGNVTANVISVSGNLTVAGSILVASNVVATQSYVTSTIATAGKNSQGNKYVSAAPPSGGSNGDIWYQI